jgi:NAD(P)-dependent dehydrogenase (short-subunit alcohol dehydrogenase family)
VTRENDGTNSSDNHREIDLGGQVAIVTGGGRGIGRAIAQELAGAGASVAVVARSKDQLAETVALVAGTGGRAIPLEGDVTDQAAVEDAVAETERQLGPVNLWSTTPATAGRSALYGKSSRKSGGAVKECVTALFVIR